MKSLVIRNCKIDDIQELATLVQNNTDLETFELCTIADECGDYVVADLSQLFVALKECKSLKHLTLFNCGIGTFCRYREYNEIPFIVNFLKSCKLKELSFWGNFIGCDDCVAMKDNKTITALSFECNSIQEKGLAAIGTFIRTNKKLLKLNISDNSYIQEGLDSIEDALQYNKTLVELHHWTEHEQVDEKQSYRSWNERIMSLYKIDRNTFNLNGIVGVIPIEEQSVKVARYSALLT